MPRIHRICSATLIVLAGMGRLVAEEQPAPSTDAVNQMKLRLDALEQQLRTLQRQIQDSGKADPASAGSAVPSNSALETRVWKLEAEDQTDNSFSVGGDGDVTLVLQKGAGYTVSADFNAIFLYGYKDTFLFVGELNASQGGVDLGQAWVAYTALPHVVIQAGLFPIPFGVYSERLSPSWINKASNLPPAPYNENYGVFSGDQTIDGAELRGDVAMANSSKLTYHVFLASPPVYNGPDNVDPDNRLSFGSANTTHVPPTVGARLGVLPMPTAEIGLSAMAGRIINNQTIDPTIDDNARRTFTAVAVDGEHRLQRIVLRGECMRLDYHDPSGARRFSQGAYVQASRRLDDLTGWRSGLEPLVRVGRTQHSQAENGFQRVSELAVGLNYYFTTFIRTSLVAVAASVHDEDLLSFNTTFAF